MVATRKLGRMVDTLNVKTAQVVPTGTRTLTALTGTIVDWPATEPCALVFVKRSTSSRLYVNIEISYFVSAGAQYAIYVLYGGVQIRVISGYCNQASEHDERGAWKELFGVAAGTYTFKVQAENLTSGGDFMCDTNDTVSLMVMEVPA